MKDPPRTRSACRPELAQTTEMLILPDGQVLVHNLTPAMAAILHELNPDDDQIRSRIVPGPPPRAPDA